MWGALPRALQINGKGMAKLPGMTLQQRGFTKRCGSWSGAPGEGTGTRVPRSLPAAGRHGLLQMLPFSRLGGKQHTGFHFSGADRPPFCTDKTLHLGLA